MKLIAVGARREDNTAFEDNPFCQESLQMTIDFFQKVGYVPPWIGYYVERENNLVGVGAFKGPPVNGTVEIAYGTFEPYQQQGVGAGICTLLVDLALKTDPAVRITARTLPEENSSTRILRKNGFKMIGPVIDPEDGEVWEWAFENRNNPAGHVSVR